MIKNELKEVVWFWILSEEYRRIKNGKISEFKKIMNSSKTFSSGLVKLEDILFNDAMSLFEEKTVDKNYLLIKHREILERINSEKIIAISKFNFEKHNALKNIKDALFLFIKGDFSLLQEEDFISMVGSRKTPKKYSEWIEKHAPKKIVVSGMANGADILAHNWSIKNNLPIIVFPGTDIYRAPVRNKEKSEIFNYASKRGLLITDTFPGSKTFDKSVFLRRNKWMAQISKEAYALYFEEQSGTLGHLKEVASANKKIFMPAEVLKANESFLKSRHTFSKILEVSEGIS